MKHKQAVRFFTVLIFTLSHEALCDEEEAQSDASPTTFRRATIFEPMTLATAGIIHFLDADLRKTDGRLSTTIVPLRAGVPIVLGSAGALVVEGAYQLYRSRLEIDETKYRASLHSIGIPLSYFFQNRRLDVYANVTPFLNTDFNGLSLDDWQVAGELLVELWFASTFKAGVGAAVTEDFGVLPVIPLISACWYPIKYFDFKMWLPSRVIATAYIWGETRRVLAIETYAGLFGKRFHHRRRRSGETVEGNVGFAFLTIGSGIDTYPTTFLRLRTSGGVYWAQATGWVNPGENSESTRASFFVSADIALGEF